MNDNSLLQQRIDRAKELLKTIRHAAIATVNEDGTPHNTPVFFMHDQELEHMYWGSSPESQHSRNISRNGAIFVVLYEANFGGGLFMKAQARIATSEELSKAIAIHNESYVRKDRPPIQKGDYTGDALQRMYIAQPEKFWVNLSECGPNGNITKDYRYEIKKEDIL